MFRVLNEVVGSAADCSRNIPRGIVTSIAIPPPEPSEHSIRIVLMRSVDLTLSIKQKRL